MNNEGAFTAGQRMEELRTQFTLQRYEPQGEDPYIAACNEALQEIFVPEHRFYKICLGAFERRADLNAIHASRLAVRAFQRPALHRRTDIRFPSDAFLSAGAWLDHQTKVLNDSGMRERFRRDMNENSVQTNYDERGKSLKLLALLMPDRFADQSRPLRILELGSGPNHNLKKLTLNSLGAGYHYNKVVAKRTREGHSLGSTEADDDPEMTDKLNTMLEMSQIAIGKCLGIDKYPFRQSVSHSHAIEWIRSQFYPSEYKDPDFLEKFDLIQASRPANVRFRQADILELPHSPHLLAQIKRHGPYDLVFYSTFLYQLTEEGRMAAEWAGDQLVNPDNGIKIYQDFIDVDPLDESKLVIEPHWGPYTYRTIIEDMRNPGQKQVLFVWRRGRCDEVQIGPAKLFVENELVKAEDLLAA